MRIPGSNAAMAPPALIPSGRAAMPWLLGGAAAVAAGLGLAPLVLVGGAMLLAAGLAVAGEGLLFLLLLVVISGVGFGWAEGGLVAFGAVQLNMGGLRWGLIVLGCVALLLRGVPRPVPRLLLPYAMLVAVVAVGLLWAPNRWEGLRNVFQFLAPLLIALVAWGHVRTTTDVRRVAGAYWVALGIGLVLMFGLHFGAPLLGLSVPAGADPFTHRGFAMWLLPCYVLALAGWRVRGGVWLAAVAALFGIGVITLARGTILAMLVTGVLALLAHPARLRPLPLLLLLAAGLGAMQYEPLRARMFANPRTGFDTNLVRITTSGQQTELAVAGINLTGRGLVWYWLYQRATTRPLAGHGTGASTELLHNEFAGTIRQPHNEYLRFFHDNGLLGLGFFLAFGVAAVVAMRRRWRSATTPPARHLALAAMLAVAAYLVISVFDNAALYVTFFTQNIFLLLILAVRAHELESMPGTVPQEP